MLGQRLIGRDYNKLFWSIEPRAMTDSGQSSSYNSTTSSPASERSDTDSDYGVVRAQVNAYDGEPLARPRDVEVEQSEKIDEDGLSPLTLEMRSDGRIPLNNW